MGGTRWTTPTSTKTPQHEKEPHMTTTLKRIAITLAPLAILAATAAPGIRW